VSNLINLGTREISSSASWRLPIVIGIPFAAILGLGIWLCPESPRWLVSRGRNDQAYAGLSVMRGLTKGTADAWVEADYAAIITAHEKDSKMRPAGWLDCFRVENKTLHRTLLGIMVQALQQL
jgi:SP family sugar:H+ symporter-like MFS transporter